MGKERLKINTEGQRKRYTWSSYPATMGLVPQPAWLSTDWVLSQFSERRMLAKFVSEGLNHSPWGEVRGQVEPSFLFLLISDSRPDFGHTY